MNNDIAQETNGANANTEANEIDTAGKTPATKVTLTKTAVIVLGILLGLVAINAVVSFVAAFIN